MARPEVVVRSGVDRRMRFSFRRADGFVVERVVRLRGQWWVKLVIMLERLVARRRAYLVLLPGGWEVWVPADRGPVGYT